MAEAATTVLAADAVPPMVTVPPDVTTKATSRDGAIVHYSASASDLVDGVVPVRCSPASRSIFLPGTFVRVRTH